MIKMDDRRARLGVYSAVCSNCKHHTGGHRCRAFNAIPEKIWLGEHDHRRPYPGDNGIQFEPIDDSDNSRP